MNRRFELPDWLIVVGGLVVLIASRPAWWSLRIRNAPALALDGFDFAITGIVPLIMLLSVTVLTVIIKTDSVGLPDWLVHPYLSTLAVLTAAALLTIRFFWSGFDDADGVSRGFGIYLALAGVAISLAGCVLALRGLRRPPADVEVEDEDDVIDDVDDVDDVDDDEYADEVEDDEEDDLVRRFNTSLATGPVAGHRRREPEPEPRRIPPLRPRSRRRSPDSAATPPSTDLPR